VTQDEHLLDDIGMEARGGKASTLGYNQVSATSGEIDSSALQGTDLNGNEVRMQLAMCLLNVSSCLVKREDPRQAAGGERAARAALIALQGMLGARGSTAVAACLRAGDTGSEPSRTDSGPHAHSSHQPVQVASVAGRIAGTCDVDGLLANPPVDRRAADLAVRAALRLARSRGMRGMYRAGHRTARAAAVLVAVATESGAAGPVRGRKWAREAYAEGRRWAFALRDAGGDVVEG